MSRVVRIWIVSFAVLFAPSAPVAQTLLAGATDGKASVSDMGAAGYEVKVSLPPGVGDMIPDLALRYSSQNGNGMLGVGWSLEGIPAIRRCPKIFAIDGAIDVVKLTRNDAICLGDERLIHVNPADLQDG